MAALSLDHVRTANNANTPDLCTGMPWFLMHEVLST